MEFHVKGARHDGWPEDAQGPVTVDLTIALEHSAWDQISRIENARTEPRRLLTGEWCENHWYNPENGRRNAFPIPGSTLEVNNGHDGSNGFLLCTGREFSDF